MGLHIQGSRWDCRTPSHCNLSKSKTGECKTRWACKTKAKFVGVQLAWWENQVCHWSAMSRQISRNLYPSQGSTANCCAFAGGDHSHLSHRGGVKANWWMTGLWCTSNMISKEGPLTGGERKERKMHNKNNKDLRRNMLPVSSKSSTHGNVGGSSYHTVGTHKASGVQPKLLLPTSSFFKTHVQECSPRGNSDKEKPTTWAIMPSSAKWKKGS